MDTGRHRPRAGQRWIVLAMCLTWTETKQGRPDPRGGFAWILAGAALFGFIYFAGGVEGRTIPLTLPFAALYVFGALAGGSRRPAPLAARPVRLFYAAAFTVAVALFAIWGGMNGGFPEFSARGFAP